MEKKWNASCLKQPSEDFDIILSQLKPSQPQSTGLRETFIERYVVERTRKAERRPE